MSSLQYRVQQNGDAASRALGTRTAYVGTPDHTLNLLAEQQKSAAQAQARVASAGNMLVNRSVDRSAQQDFLEDPSHYALGKDKVLSSEQLHSQSPQRRAVAKPPAPRQVLGVKVNQRLAPVNQELRQRNAFDAFKNAIKPRPQQNVSPMPNGQQLQYRVDPVLTLPLRSNGQPISQYEFAQNVPTADARDSVQTVEFRDRNGGDVNSAIDAAVRSGTLRTSQSALVYAEFPQDASQGTTMVTIARDMAHPEARVGAAVVYSGVPVSIATHQIPADSFPDMFGRDMQLNLQDNNLLPPFSEAQLAQRMRA